MSQFCAKDCKNIQCKIKLYQGLVCREHDEDGVTRMKRYPLSAGAAKGDITLGENILPIPFFLTIEMNRVVDPIYVRVLDIDDGHQRALFITFDMLIVPNPEETMEFICDYTGLSKEYVFLAATHTHEVPLLGFSETTSSEAETKYKLWYTEILETLKETIKRAEEAKRPARIGYSTGKSYININRDEIIDGKGTIGNNFERPSDKTLALVRIEDKEGVPIAFIVNYAVHAVVMNGCLVDGTIGICGDLPGKTSAMLEEKFDGAVALWTSGAAGDQNPRIMTQYTTNTKEGETVVKSLGESGYIILDFLANEHVRDIIAVNKSLVCDKTEAKIFASERLAVCPRRIRDAEPDESFKNTEESELTVTYTLRLLTIGDIAFEGISAEVVTSIGMALKSASPYEKTMVVTHVGTYCGYVPDDWGYKNNTFEAKGTLVQKGYAQPAFLKGFAEMFDEEQRLRTDSKP
jgi:neutral ceramidase